MRVCDFYISKRKEKRTEDKCSGLVVAVATVVATPGSSLGRYVFGSEISYNKPPPRLPGLGC